MDDFSADKLFFSGQSSGQNVKKKKASEQNCGGQKRQQTELLMNTSNGQGFGGKGGGKTVDRALQDKTPNGESFREQNPDGQSFRGGGGILQAEL